MANTHETRFVLTAKNKTKGVFGKVKNELGALKKGVTGLHTGFLALAGIAGAGLLTKSLIGVNAEFQTIKSSLATLTGGTKEAAEAFELIEEFATTTPFDLQQVTQSFIKLKALGLDPSAAALESYGNTASAMGKSLDQMIEAVADASTGEFERLKEFGIKASKQGDEVSFTFQGVETTIKNSAANIQGYLMGIGNVNFAGAMKDQMGNLGPAFSNFGTAVDMLQVKIGEAGLNEAIAGITNELTAMIEAMDASAIAEFSRDAIKNLAEFLTWWDTATSAIGGVMITGQIENLPGAGMIPPPTAAPSEVPNFLSWGDRIRQQQQAQGMGTGAQGREVWARQLTESEKQTGFLERVVDILDKSTNGATAQ
jgi:hypothetical protein